ncbi:MAG TPA: tRNA (N(6)-L-threonylcarbamoyladenosine(37)-C(2))-methylthiotransferase MtaB [Candidatus Omnitrophota bacterium]|nr:tRNA (N(6)-L-threonylcarbamoyladenosine(37)-C(2))-methylthiotransferase MtaB [Candidatus Omnitrophota bacterium]HPD85396.1 tRNA (N(6)-L-threonylcarbamoyladenosine(37)-C(2))-methylthiotransferase MtaB [Candidatus Omnitrophota bacterium]HRZ04103.1 tRNA (N(6)-L-threonylcarbamoyladenosine(37)-C(2))-methylthiotransferase MtaB [Candidatus Omnitrophota bacterium]
MPNRVAFYTLGCRLNQSETASLERSFQAQGYRIVDFGASADIVVVNTCTVTERGDADTRRLVNKINRVNPKARIALIGCQAQIQKEQLAKLPNVRFVVGNARKMDLPVILRDVQSTDSDKSAQIIVPAIPRTSFTQAVAGIDRHHTRANLKIQDGCDFFCSFCEIPFARGRARSRVFDNIFTEARVLVEAGHKELVLTGINLGAYRYQQKTILDVLDKLDKIDNLERIRISSIEPTTIPFELIKRMGKTKLCRYLHIPLESGSNSVLKAMRRKYTTQEFADFITRSRRAVPGLCIGTDVMVGFPGESEKCFNETFEYLSNLPVSYFHVFSYSDRTLNKSRTYADKVPHNIIQQRSQALRNLGQQKRRIFMESLLGTRQKVLFEQKKDGLWTGLTDNYVRVKAGSQKNLRNQLLSVSLKQISGQAITGCLAPKLTGTGKKLR